MASYYDEILAEIREYIRSGRLADASAMTERELAMPYIPPETEQQLIRIRKELRYRMADRKELREESLDSLLGKLLYGDEKEQLHAAASLTERNMRSFLDEVRSYLEQEPLPEAASLLIEAAAQQRIQDELTYRKDGVTYEFYADSVTPVAESEGFRNALARLEDMLGNDHPDILKMCRTLLIREAYLCLPLSYEKDEGEMLAQSVLKEVSRMMDGGKLYRSFYPETE